MLPCILTHTHTHMDAVHPHMHTHTQHTHSPLHAHHTDLYISVYIIQSVCFCVCLFAVNAKTTAWIDTKCSRITKNDPETVLHRFKSPVLVLSGRYRDIFSFFFVANSHFYLSPFHFQLLPRLLTTEHFRLNADSSAP